MMSFPSQRSYNQDLSGSFGFQPDSSGSLKNGTRWLFYWGLPHRFRGEGVPQGKQISEGLGSTPALRPGCSGYTCSSLQARFGFLLCSSSCQRSRFGVSQSNGNSCYAPKKKEDAIDMNVDVALSAAGFSRSNEAVGRFGATSPVVTWRR